MTNHSRPVYSTGSGRICPDCGMPVADCVCGKQPVSDSKDGLARIRREVKGRKGKTVTTVAGLDLNEETLRRLASELKRSCGTGGSVKDRIILIQGDRLQQIKSFLEKRGFKVRQTGG